MFDWRNIRNLSLKRLEHAELFTHVEVPINYPFEDGRWLLDDVLITGSDLPDGCKRKMCKVECKWTSIPNSAHGGKSISSAYLSSTLKMCYVSEGGKPLRRNLPKRGLLSGKDMLGAATAEWVHLKWGCIAREPSNQSFLTFVVDNVVKPGLHSQKKRCRIIAGSRMNSGIYEVMEYPFVDRSN